MPKRTETTITDLQRFATELSLTRERGYSVDDCEYEDEGRCVAVPLIGIGLPASISLSAPATRFPMSDVPEVAEALRQAAELLVTDFTGNPNVV
jgi:IclR family acetate operon transcriptional repressor